MPRILFIHSSAHASEARKDVRGSYTRKMARLLRDAVRERGVRITERDIAARPPRLIDYAWIGASLKPESARTAEDRQHLAESDELVDEVLGSDVIVVGCPVYNFGVPAPLKAWIDNIVRPGRTYTEIKHVKPRKVYGMLHAKRVVLLVSSGSSGYQPGGPREALNHADSAVCAIFSQLGVHSFDKVVFEGSNEDSDEVIAENWLRCEARIARLAASIRQRWLSGE